MREKNSDSGRSTRLRFCLRADVAIADFGDRSLVLLCDSLQLREINGRSRQVLALLDGRRTVQDIAMAVASKCEVAAREMTEPVAEALLKMERQGIVRRVVQMTMERPERMNEAKYMVNPDVSFRQEDEDGGILYNADSDSLEVVNPTAAAIWTFLAAPRAHAEVVAHLCAICEGASREQVEKDVGEFLESLLKKGFIGVVENPS
jgi:hypothetical protein